MCVTFSAFWLRHCESCRNARLRSYFSAKVFVLRSMGNELVPSSQMSSYIAMNNKEVDYGMVKALDEASTS